MNAYASKLDRAEAAYRRAYELIRAIVPADAVSAQGNLRSQLDWSEQRLAEVLVQLGRLTEARDLLRANVELYRKTNPQNLDDALFRLGSVLLKAEEWQGAEAVLKECHELQEKAAPDHWRTFNAQSLLGGALLGQKKYTDAEPLLAKGYEGMKAREKTIPPQAATRIPEALDRLIELYTATNRPDEAAKWRAERAKYREAAPAAREKK